jgi:hypothetical protein
MKTPAPITVRQVRELFDYDTETGVMRYRVSRRRFRAGTEAGCLRPDGRVHFHGRWPACEIDHENRNRIDNLREATRPENGANTRSQPSSTGVRGVRLKDNPDRPYEASITARGVYRYLGSFATLRQAAAAVDAAREKYHGEFAFQEAA